MTPRRHGATVPVGLQARVGCLLFGSILRLFGRGRRIAVGDIFEQAGRRFGCRRLYEADLEAAADLRGRDIG